MPRRELNSADAPIEQKRPIVGDKGIREHEGDVIAIGDKDIRSKDYLDELKFMEEPVTIRLEPSADKNAATAFPIWVNGKGCEVWNENQKRFIEMPYLPVGEVLTVKRKYVEVLIRAKIDTVETKILDEKGENPTNTVRRFTSAVHNFSIIEDRNPMGAPWLTELRRRNM